MGLGEYEDFSEKCPPVHILFCSRIGFQRVIGGKGREERKAEALPCHRDHGMWTVLGREVGFES